MSACFGWKQERHPVLCFFEVSRVQTCSSYPALVYCHGIPLSWLSVAHAQSGAVTLPRYGDRIPPGEDPLGVSTPNCAMLSRKLASTRIRRASLADVPGMSVYSAGGVSSLPSLHGSGMIARIKVDGMDLVSACANHT